MSFIDPSNRNISFGTGPALTSSPIQVRSQQNVPTYQIQGEQYPVVVNRPSRIISQSTTAPVNIVSGNLIEAAPGYTVTSGATLVPKSNSFRIIEDQPFVKEIRPLGSTQYLAAPQVQYATTQVIPNYTIASEPSSLTYQVRPSMAISGSTYLPLDQTQKTTLIGAYPGERKSLAVTGSVDLQNAKNSVSNVRVIRGEPRVTVRQGGEKVIGQTQLPRHVISEQEMPSTVVQTNQLQPHEVSRQKIELNAVVQQNALAGHTQKPSVTNQVIGKDFVTKSEQAIINQKVVDKYIDVTVEVPKQNIIEKLVPYDVIVEKPREVITTKDVVTEVIIEKPYEKIIDVPVKKVVEVPIKKTVQRINYVDIVTPVVYEYQVQEPIRQIQEKIEYRDEIIEVDEREVGRYKADLVLPVRTQVQAQNVVETVKKDIICYTEEEVAVPKEYIEIVKKPEIKYEPYEEIVEQEEYVVKEKEVVEEVPQYAVNYRLRKEVRAGGQSGLISYELLDTILNKPEYGAILVDGVKVAENPLDFLNKIKSEEFNRRIFVNKPRLEIERTHVQYETTVSEMPDIIFQEVINETVIPKLKDYIQENTVDLPVDKVVKIKTTQNKNVYVTKNVVNEIVEDQIEEDIQYVDKVKEVFVEKLIEKPVVRERVKQVDKVIPRNVERKKVEDIVIKKPVRTTENVVVPLEVIIEKPVIKEVQVFNDIRIDQNTRLSVRPTGAVGPGVNLLGKVNEQRKKISDLKIKTEQSKIEYETLINTQKYITESVVIDYKSQNEFLQKRIADLEQAIRDFDANTIRRSMMQVRQ